MTGGRGQVKKTRGEKFRDCCKFIWNSQTHECLGRTGKSWALIGLFYLIYYGALAGFFAICLAVFYQTMDDRAPTQQQMYSLLKQNPGMGYRPRPNSDGTLVSFRVDDPSTYKEYLENLEETLNLNEKAKGDVVPIDCTDIEPGKREEPQVCEFKLGMLGDQCTKEKQFGYPEGKPCILLKMNKVYAWSPDPLDNGTANPLGDRLDPNYVGVTCEGEIDTDKDNIRNMTYYPEKGFPSVFYPYLNQPGYQTPYVMVQFDVIPGRLLMIWCKVWAKNIKHHRVDLQGSVHFELLVDVPKSNQPPATAVPTVAPPPSAAPSDPVVPASTTEVPPTF